VECTVTTPELIPEKELSGDKRRNIFLSLKETLNNVLKHAEATSVNISIETNHSLKIMVADNGKGIDINNIRQFGNGLNNMKRRMESIGGTFSIENKAGTCTILELPL
jgi:signal transduction histidine kinase